MLELLAAMNPRSPQTARFDLQLGENVRQIGVEQASPFV